MEVFARALELDWVETIMFPYNIVESQGEELISKCKEKNIGFIDMNLWPVVQLKMERWHCVMSVRIRTLLL